MFIFSLVADRAGAAGASRSQANACSLFRVVGDLGRLN